MKTNLDTADLAVTAAALVISLFISRALIPDYLVRSSCLTFGFLATAILLLLEGVWLLLSRKRRRKE